MRRAPQLVNGIAFVGNLIDALFWAGVNYGHPTPDNMQSLNECLIMAGENFVEMTFPYLEKLRKRTPFSRDQNVNTAGALYNLGFGLVNYFIDYALTAGNALKADVGGYFSAPPRSVSRIIQPMVNMVGIGMNSFEAYDNLERNRPRKYP